MNKITNDIIKNTKDFLYNEETKNNYKTTESAFSRKRKLTFLILIFMTLNFMKKSLQIEINNFFDYVENDIFSTVTKQAFSKARQLIKPELYNELFEITVRASLKNNGIKSLNKHRFFAIDGTEFQMPKTKETTEYFPQAHGTDIPKARVSMLCDVLSGFVIHAEIDKTSIDERTLAKRHLKFFLQCKKKNDVVIFDRGYPSKNMIEFLHENKIKYIIRLQKSFSKTIDEKEESDFITYINNRKLRVLKFELTSGETETLITNLGAKAFTEEEFHALYHLRWAIEVKFDLIKNILDIEMFSGKTINVVLQEFYAHLYMANLINSIKLESDSIVENLDSEKDLMYERKTNQNTLIGHSKNRLIKLLFERNSAILASLYSDFISIISNYKISIVKGRSFVRKMYTKKVLQKPRKAL